MAGFLQDPQNIQSLQGPNPLNNPVLGKMLQERALAAQQPQESQATAAPAMPTLGRVEHTHDIAGMEAPQAAAPSAAAPTPAPTTLQSAPMPKPLAKIAPVQPSPAELAHQTEYNRLTGAGPNPNEGKSGISQIHNPVGRTLLHIAEAVGGGLFPTIAMGIPGTQLHHQMLVGNESRALDQEQRNRKDTAQEQLENAKAQHQFDLDNGEAKSPTTEIGLFLKDPAQFAKYREMVQRAQATGKPEFIKDGEGNIVGMVDSKGVPHSASDPNLDPQAKAIMDAAKPRQPSLPEGERPLPNADNLNKALEARFQVLNPGKPLPPQFQIPPNATQKDYDRVDKALEAVERATGTREQQNQTMEMRRQTAALAAANAGRAEERPGKTILDKAEATFHQAHQSAEDLRNFISMAQAGNKVTAQAIPLEGTLAIVTSQGVKRINRTEVEQNQAAGSLFDNIMGRVGKLGSGQPVPPDLLRDWAKLADMMERTSYDTYKSTFDSAKKRYHLNDEEPLPGPGGGAGSTNRGANDSRYQVNHLYGGKKYLGGDINKPENWQ